jgi:hypothetical protein
MGRVFKLPSGAKAPVLSIHIGMAEPMPLQKRTNILYTCMKTALEEELRAELQDARIIR